MFTSLGAVSVLRTIRGPRVLQKSTIRSKFSCRTGPVPSAAMKFILIAAVALLALAQGSSAQDATDLEKLTQYFEEMRTKLTHDLTELINNQDLANQAKTFISDGQAQLEPLAAQVQEKLRTVATNVEEQIKPMAANVQAQVQPMMENFQQQVQAILQKLMDQTQAIGN
ncbi:type-4 ice-structuring protein LS-12-like [Notolabrus celidotus]|uniref:type-4 ice-structuring protein LS-12-like n=1 Tax=Notolabrus celidotus TaxID=1203425 RepID=UPI00148F4E1B|nr:type-4 ice-structuring protein LS-12-like [Notolabrus celidotus]